jgi:hypothetical protein
MRDEGLREAAIAEGMVGMSEDGRSKVLLGITSLEEVLRVASRPCGSRRRHRVAAPATDRLGGAAQNESQELSVIERTKRRVV